MLENNNYNLGREWDFYVTILQGINKGGTAITIRKEVSHKSLNIRKTFQVVTLEV